MPTNITVDDTSADIVYSNWSPQIPNDPNASDFFLSTYHMAQANGATANITFQGQSIFLYGSMGPDHANYSVQFDNLVIILSANQPTLLFQQNLFGFTFDTYGQHFISLEAIYTSEGQWLDLDFVTISVNGSSPQTTLDPSPTVLPPWISGSPGSTSSAQTTSSSSSNASSLSDASSTSSTNNTTLILTILFGVLLGLVVIASIVFCIVRRIRNQRDQRERQFRLGTGNTYNESRQNRGSKYTPAETPMHAIENPTTQPSLFNARASNAKFNEARQDQLEHLEYHHAKSSSGRVNAARTNGAEQQSGSYSRVASPQTDGAHQSLRVKMSSPTAESAMTGLNTVTEGSTVAIPSLHSPNTYTFPHMSPSTPTNAGFNIDAPAPADSSHPVSIQRMASPTARDPPSSKQEIPSIDGELFVPPRKTHADIEETYLRTESPHSFSPSHATSISYPVARLIPNRAPMIPPEVKGPPPPRPRRPSNNLLEWLAGSPARYEKTVQPPKKNAAPSTKSNFLSFGE